MDVSDGGLSLLKHPSAAMTRLLLSTTGTSGGGDQTLQRPVVSFVVQQHSLDELQIAMKQALRKAACRVYALQVGPQPGGGGGGGEYLWFSLYHRINRSQFFSCHRR